MDNTVERLEAALKETSLALDAAVAELDALRADAQRRVALQIIQRLMQQLQGYDPAYYHRNAAYRMAEAFLASQPPAPQE